MDRRMPYSACLVLAIVLGTLGGFVIAGHDLEGGVLGAVAGWFLASIIHTNRRLATPRGMALIAIVGLAAIVALELWFADAGRRDEAGFIWRDASVELRPVRKLKGITLGESLAEVSARQGAFRVDEAAPVREGARNYIQPDSRIRLRVVGDQVTRVSYECAGNDEETRLNRIKCHTYDTRILEVFGQGVRRLCSKAAPPPTAFAYDVFNTGTRYIVLDGHVRGFIVMEPEDLDAAVGGDQPWRACD